MPKDEKRKKSTQSFERASAQHHGIKPTMTPKAADQLPLVPPMVSKREELIWKRFLLQEMKK